MANRPSVLRAPTALLTHLPPHPISFTLLQPRQLAFCVAPECHALPASGHLLLLFPCTDSFFPDASMAGPAHCSQLSLNVTSLERTSPATLSKPIQPLLYCCLVFFWALITIWSILTFVGSPASSLCGQWPCLSHSLLEPQHWEQAQLITALNNVCWLNKGTKRQSCV